MIRYVSLVDDLRMRFSALMAPTGRLRDLDVLISAQDTQYTLIPKGLHGGLAVMHDVQCEIRSRCQADVAAYFQSQDYQREVSALQEVFSIHTASGEFGHGKREARPVVSYANQLIWTRYQKFCAAARQITDETDDDAVHDLRIRCKKLRYLVEFFAHQYPKHDIKRVLKPLKHLQENLGLFNDCAVQQVDLLNGVDTQKLTGDQAIMVAQSTGALIAVLHQRQQVERAKVVHNIQQFDSVNIRALCRQLFFQT